MATLSRLALAALGIGCLAGAPVFADDRPTLRGDVVARHDTLTLGDLVAGAPAGLAATALFRAPALGGAGTVQTHRIVEAAASLGLASVETGGRMQVTITRAARVIGPGEIETLLRRALERDAGLDPRAIGITFDGAPPSLVAAPDIAGDPVAADVLFDRRSRRITATVYLGPSATERRASLAVSGTAVETSEVAVLARPLDRGEAIRAADVTVERRPRETVSADAVYDGGALEGRVARRALGAGGVIRSGDLVKPELVGKGDTVTMVYEAPGIALSLRARASEGGALGDTIPVLNPGSKKTVLARIIGPGKVSVNPGDASRAVASAASPALR